jgi:Flp pilus assembly protein CpaB
MVRAVYLGIFLVLALGAGGIYYATTRETTIVVANGDLRVGTSIAESSVAVKRVHPSDVPAGSATRMSDVVGRFVSWPILDGQFIPVRALARDRASLIAGGLSVPAGYRALSLAVTATDAAGGVLRPGDLVDVVAVAKGLAPGASPPPATTLGKRVLVLGVRTDQGQPLDASGGSGSVRGLNFSSNRIASVVVAVAPDDEERYAAAAAVSSFTMVLNLD